MKLAIADFRSYSSRLFVASMGNTLESEGGLVNLEESSRRQEKQDDVAAQGENKTLSNIKETGTAVNSSAEVPGSMNWKDAPAWWTVPSLVKLYLLVLPSLLTQFAWGFDITMTNSVQSITIWQQTYGHPTGSELGFFGASTSVGEVVGILFAFFLTDWWGRKPTVALGCVFVLIGVFTQAWAPNVDVFAGGKLILGFGTIIAQVAAPILCMELAHPKDRVGFMGLYGAGLYLGLTSGAWISYGTNTIQSNWAWRIPILLQATFPLYQSTCIWLCPESPRWLVSKGQEDKALDILVKYHGNGEPTPYVIAEFTEIKETVELEAMWARETKWSDIIGSKGNRKRLFTAICVGSMSQTLGANIISTYLPVVLDGVGYDSSRTKLLINALLTLWGFIFCLLGGAISPYLKRRQHFLIGTAGLFFSFLTWTIAAQQYSTTGSIAAGKTVLAVVFIFTAFNSVSWIVITIAYPLECMPMKLRTKFFSVLLMAIQLSAVFSAYVVPVGLENVGWKFYLYDTVWIACSWFIIYFFFVETHGPSLEEIAVFFDGDDALVGGVGRTHAAEQIMRDHKANFEHTETG